VSDVHDLHTLLDDPHTMGLAVETVVPWLGDAGRILEYGVRFTRPVLVDAEDGADVHVVAAVGAVSIVSTDSRPSGALTR